MKKCQKNYYKMQKYKILIVIGKAFSIIFPQIFIEYENFPKNWKNQLSGN